MRKKFKCFTTHIDTQNTKKQKTGVTIPMSDKTNFNLKKLQETMDITQSEISQS